MYKRILIAVDGSSASVRGLREGIRLAKAMDARVMLVHVVNQLILESEVASTAYYQALSDALRASGSKILEGAAIVARDAGISFEQKMVEKLGAPSAEEILSVAKNWQAELIVLGTHGRRGLRRLVMGSDAEMVLRDSPVPVLMVRDRPEQAVH